MGKSLFIVRHAQADWVNQNSDFDRPLTNSGLRDAKRVANLFRSCCSTPKIWLTSSAARTRSTARLFADILQVGTEYIQSRDNLYLGSVSAHLQAINEFNDQFSSAIIFGHNPGVSELIAYLCDTRYVDMETGTLAEVEFPDADIWAEISGGSGSPKRFLYPNQEYAKW